MIKDVFGIFILGNNSSEKFPKGGDLGFSDNNFINIRKSHGARTSHSATFGSFGSSGILVSQTTIAMI